MAGFILLLPLLGFLFIGLLNRHFSTKIVSVVGCGTVFIAFVLSVLTFLNLRDNPGTVIDFTILEWIAAGNFSVTFSFLVDPLSSLMLLIITGVGFLIHVYSIGYMHSDDGFNRFFAYLNLFIFFMVVLVMGSNYLVMFAGWEGVGLSSYLLIGFWYKNADYNRAARKAFVMNRIGDLGLLLGVILLFVHFGSLTYADVFAKAGSLAGDGTVLTLITLLLFVGAVGKSAQIPLYTWLPDAMAGPTPVSALIHAATMVTAGIYLVVRNNILYTLAPITSDIIAVIGLTTALLAATIAVLQNDIKKILAYSTVSQLGLVFTALGAHAYTAAMFHTTTHAFFKALLFLGAGSVIHSLHGEQDVRRMGGLGKYLPITHLTFLIGVLAISGIPPFAGFFSKDEILSHVFIHNPVLWVLSVITSLLTVFYMFRLYFLTFRGSVRANENVMKNIHESPSSMALPLIGLGILSVAGGFINVPEVFGGSMALKDFLSPVFNSAASPPTEHHLSASTEIALMALVLAGTIAVIVTAFMIYVWKEQVPSSDVSTLNKVQTLVYYKYYIDELYNKVIGTPLFRVSAWLHSVDRLIIDRFVNGTGKVVAKGAQAARLLQSGNIGFYIFVMVISVIAILVTQTFIL